MKKSYLRCASLGALLFVGLPSLQAETTTPPNVIVILADDLGYGDLGYHGSKDIPTPNIDSLSKKGVTFTAAYDTAPVCAPSRAGFLTGRYQNRFGYEDNPGPFTRTTETKIGLPTTEKTIGDRMKAAGYHTGLIGKWHDGSLPEFSPMNRGFDEFFGFIDGASTYDIGNNPQKKLQRGNEPVACENEYLTDAFGREASAFIEKNHEKPFFLYLAFNAVHGPLMATDAYKAKVGDIQDPKRKTLAAMAYAMDENIGRVMKTLEKCNIADNTLVIFFSDNGAEHLPNEQVATSTPLRGFKGDLFEGGMRTPLCMYWPKVLPAGKKIDAPVMSVDFMPTALGAAGQTADPSWKLDGVNLLPFIKGETTTVPHDTLHWRFNNMWAIRNAEWKLVNQPPNQAPMLFHISEDISETKDLAAERPEIVAELKKAHEEWAAGLMDKQWGWGGAGLIKREDLIEFKKDK